MRILQVAAGALLLVAAGGVWAHPPEFHYQGNRKIAVVAYEDGRFTPARVEIDPGGQVVFVNHSGDDFWPASNDHPTHEVYDGFDSRKPVSDGELWAFSFDEPGEWEYHNHLTPDQGAVVVVGSGTASTRADGAPAVVPTADPDRPDGVLAWARETLVALFVGGDGDSPSADETDDATETFGISPLYGGHECASIDKSCVAKAIRAKTNDDGPVAAGDLLALLLSDGRVDGSVVDEHQLAHEMGRQTAETYGVSSEAFMRCPMSAYNGGCQHGYFEYVLGKTDATTEAAEIICKSLAGTYSSKDYFYCYHGVGHGVMMAQAYQLDRALVICDELPGRIKQHGCWQGVFMENVNAGLSGKARSGVFSPDDPLAPCNALESKYQHECYVNHAGWLMKVFDKGVERASAACLDADPRFVPSCLQSIGLMVTNPVWQRTLFRPSLWQRVQLAVFGTAFGASFETVSWKLCRAFPSGHRDQCVVGAVDNIMNFDGFEISRAKVFCGEVDEGFRTLCHTRIGRGLRTQATHPAMVRQTCLAFEGSDWSACLDGAGL